MPKFTVHFMTAYCTWEGVEAESEDKAIEKVGVPAEFDGNDPFSFVVVEEENEEEE